MTENNILIFRVTDCNKEDLPKTVTFARDFSWAIQSILIAIGEGKENNIISIAMVNPEDEETPKKIQDRVGQEIKIKVFRTFPKDIQKALRIGQYPEDYFEDEDGIKQLRFKLHEKR